MDPSALAALRHPGNLSFPTNLRYVTDFSAAGGQVVRRDSGHLIFYTSEGRRFLKTDPGGTALHECQWEGTHLTEARVWLDWGQWVGIKPGGMVNSTVLDLSRKPGWQRLGADDLRQMAAQAMQVPIEEVRFFYGSDDLVISTQGQATIRHRKDVLYVLEDGTFGQRRFMACMGAMHWGHIDFLPVVELFQSLLPGTGSAVFELIRGLYDDQNVSAAAKRTLRYRGIPTYPSEAAFRLFSSFFTPTAPGTDPFRVFMDASQAHHVTWLPAREPPRRYVDATRRLCLTIAGDRVQKVTDPNDSTGLSYLPFNGRYAPGDRSVSVGHATLVLHDGAQQREIPLDAAWGPLRELPTAVASSVGWRSVFHGSLPPVTPFEAYSAVLLYPDDDTEISELASQPFVADYLLDALETDPALTSAWHRASRVLISNADAVIGRCLRWDQPREYTIHYCRPAFAQKQAQMLWNQLAAAGRLDLLKQVQFVPVLSGHAATARQDWVYLWMPFEEFDHPNRLDVRIREATIAMEAGATAFIIGPSDLLPFFQPHRLQVLEQHAVAALEPFRMHQTVLPRARLKTGLTLYHMRRLP